MAVNFLPNSWTIQNWGFSAGDVAVVAGASRPVVTWVMTQVKDRALMDFLSLDVDTLITRKGIMNVNEVHRRWDDKLYLLRNGRRTPIYGENGAPLVGNMDKFGWFMILLTGVLHAAVDYKSLLMILTDFMCKLCEDSPAGREYLERDIRLNIQGWHSAACVRGILNTTTGLWGRYSTENLHLPGYIPSLDHRGVKELFIWLAKDGDKRFFTHSSDVWCVARMLEEIGVEIRTSLDIDEQFDEGQLVVYKQNDYTHAANRSTEQLVRRGMRVPLEFMEEVASLFPENRNKARSYFHAGMSVIEADKVKLIPRFLDDPSQFAGSSPNPEQVSDLCYEIWSNTTSSQMPRLSTDATRIMSFLFPIQTPKTAKEFGDILINLDIDTHELETYLKANPVGFKSNAEATQWTSRDEFSALQMFILGYYYRLLRPLLDTSQLEMQEAFGSWGWCDIGSLKFLQSIVCKVFGFRNVRQRFINRHDILKLLGYLFVSADIDQLNTVWKGAIGVTGKLMVVISTLLGATHQPDDFGKFCLLDIDPTCIPSSTAGVIVSRFPTWHTSKSLPSSPLVELDALPDFPASAGFREDFTIHIEPDWDRDAETCLIAYRHEGRIVNRLNPRQVDIMLWRQWFENRMVLAHSLDPKSSQISPVPINTRQSSTAGISRRSPLKSVFRDPSCLPTHIQPVSIEEFYGGFRPSPVIGTDRTKVRPVLVNVVGFHNAWLCIMAMYEGWEGNGELGSVSSRDEVVQAIIKDYKTVLVMC